MADGPKARKRVLVVGASGRTGRFLVARALNRGLVVSAFVRDPARLSIAHPGLRVFAGDVRVPEDIAPAMADQDVVVSILSQASTSNVTIFSEGTRNLADAAEVWGVRRLIVVSAAAAGIAPEDLPIPTRLAMLVPAMAASYYDMEIMENELMERDLDWTIVRPAGLVDVGTQDVKIEVGPFVEGAESTARVDLAEFLLHLVETDSFIRERVAIAG